MMRTEMKPTRPQVELVVFSAIESVNQELNPAQALRASEAQQLFGSETSISSLTLVTLVIRIEQILAEVYGMQVVLADERALSRSQSPFRTVGSLIEYISELSNG